MCRQPSFSNFIHTFASYLYLDPTVFGSPHCYMQRFISIAFGYRKPIFKSFRIRLVHIGNNRIHFPTICLFLIFRCIQDYPYGEQIINIFKLGLLLLYLIQYRRYRLCSSLNLEFQSGSLEFSLHRFYKFINIFIPGSFRFIQFSGNLIESRPIGIFQSEVF